MINLEEIAQKSAEEQLQIFHDLHQDYLEKTERRFQYTVLADQHPEDHSAEARELYAWMVETYPQLADLEGYLYFNSPHEIVREEMAEHIDKLINAELLWDEDPDHENRDIMFYVNGALKTRTGGLAEENLTLLGKAMMDRFRVGREAEAAATVRQSPMPGISPG
jgi:hypothetical protein